MVRVWRRGTRGAVAIALGMAAIGFPGAAMAQIVPDGTLGSEGSIVTPGLELDGRILDRIDGGAIRDANLFHSFSEFNVGTLQQVYFANPAGIDRILTRITGENLSTISGTLGVLGDADLFFLNPNGIIFTDSAILDLNGSFIASTADSIVFDNFNFSASSPQMPPLLTMGVPLGLQYGTNPGSIVNSARVRPDLLGDRIHFPSQIPATNSIRTAPGLQVVPGETIALVGGELQLTNGNVTALGGRIELGSVASDDTVSLTQVANGWALSYENIEAFSDISLSNQATVDASGVIFPNGPMVPPVPIVMGNSGDVQVRGRNISLDSSAIASTHFGMGTGGSLSITASSLTLQGETIRTPADPTGQLPPGLIAQVFSPGQGGDITITTETLTVLDGNGISASTQGAGNAGNLTVNVSESILIDGSGVVMLPNGMMMRFPSGLFATQDAFGAPGNGGNLTVNTERLIVREGGNISTGNRGSGVGGNLTVNAESIELNGQRVDGQFPSGLFSSTNGPGNGGSLFVNSEEIVVEDGATISVRGVLQVPMMPPGMGGGMPPGMPGTPPPGMGSEMPGEPGSQPPGMEGGMLSMSPIEAGNAGNLFVVAEDIRLLDGGTIFASSESGNGGNINIFTETIVGFDNSDIIADARREGGQIFISAEGIFGLEDLSREEVEELGEDFDPREPRDDEFDNTISSISDDPSLDGAVILNTPEVDTTDDVFEAESPTNPEQQIASGCEANVGENISWYIESGWGGLQRNPGDAVSPPAIWSDPDSPETVGNSDANSTEVEAIVEAQNWEWVEGEEGAIVRFVSTSRDVVPYSSWQSPGGCDE